MLRLLAVDLDGVIADTFWIHEVGWEFLLLQEGLKRTTSFAFLRGVSTRVAIVELFKRYGVEVSDEKLNKLVRQKDNIKQVLIGRINDRETLLPPSRLLSEAKELGIHTACLATTTSAKCILDKLDLSRLIDRLIFGRELYSLKKDSSSCLEEVALQLGLKPDDVLFIDDDQRAVHVALGSGFRSLLASHGGSLSAQDGDRWKVLKEGLSLEDLYDAARSDAPRGLS